MPPHDAPTRSPRSPSSLPDFCLYLYSFDCGSPSPVHVRLADAAAGSRLSSVLVSKRPLSAPSAAPVLFDIVLPVLCLPCFRVPVPVRACCAQMTFVFVLPLRTLVLHPRSRSRLFMPFPFLSSFFLISSWAGRPDRHCAPLPPSLPLHRIPILSRAHLLFTHTHTHSLASSPLQKKTNQTQRSLYSTVPIPPTSHLPSSYPRTCARCRP